MQKKNYDAYRLYFPWWDNSPHLENLECEGGGINLENVLVKV